MATFLGAQWTFLLAFTTIALFGAIRIDRATAVARDALRLGQYVLVERLGAGGMGEVHRAEHRLLRRPCAITLIRPEHAGDPNVLRRFEREVQTTATLTHPNTIAIYDYGITDDGTFYYVMEYLPGNTLEQLVMRDGPMDARRAIHVLRQIGGALHEAHSTGLTHRDIKPGNVMLDERGGVADMAKLLDFGLVTTPNADSEAGDVAAGGITQVGMVLGTRPPTCPPSSAPASNSPAPPEICTASARSDTSWSLDNPHSRRAHCGRKHQRPSTPSCSNVWQNAPKIVSPAPKRWNKRSATRNRSRRFSRTPTPATPLEIRVPRSTTAPHCGTRTPGRSAGRRTTRHPTRERRPASRASSTS